MKVENIKRIYSITTKSVRTGKSMMLKESDIQIAHKLYITCLKNIMNINIKKLAI